MCRKSPGTGPRSGLRYHLVLSTVNEHNTPSVKMLATPGGIPDDFEVWRGALDSEPTFLEWSYECYQFTGLRW